jgi:fatty-acyl-CoA synthase
VTRPSAGEPAGVGRVLEHRPDGALGPVAGYIELRDRAKDIIISGGANISTIEVEQALVRHPDVLEAAVVGIPDEKWGERPKGFVTLRPGADLSEADLIAFSRETLPGFKAPSQIEFGELPKTSTGKIRKVELRERVRQASQAAAPPV